jgi:hypothetical protein
MATPHERLPLRVAVRCFWRSLKQDLFDTYRPELHYMRGPGPKWNAKHGPRSPGPATSGLLDASI